MESPPTKEVQSTEVNVSGVANGSSSYSNDYGTQPTPKNDKQKTDTPPANRQGIDDVFRSFGQLIAASRRPLPTQNGDGTYNDLKLRTGLKRTGLKKDLKVIKLKGMLFRTFLCLYFS